MRIVSFGEILLRLSSPGYTRLFQKDSLDATFCGGEANVAVSLANFGLNSAFVTKVPDTAVGHAAIHSMDYFKVDTTSIIYGGKRLGLYYLEKGASQRASTVLYDRAGSSIAEAEPSDFNWNKIFEGSDWFHWTGINPALSENMVKITTEAVRTAHDMGLTVSCDLNYRGNLWSSEKAKAVMSTMMPYVDVCIGNEEDAEKVLGIRADSSNVETGEINKNNYESVARQICDIYGCKKVAITMRESYTASRNGWSGMLFDGKTRKFEISTTYDIQIVDRVGGGDSFTAGLIYGLNQGRDDKYAVEFATAASCLKQTMEGDYNRTTVSEVEKLMKNGGSGRIQR